MICYTVNMNSKQDERNTIFSRIIELKPGGDNYTEYYKNNPEKEETDSRLRSHPPGVFADKLTEQAVVEGTFRLLAKLRSLTGHEKKAPDLPQIIGPISENDNANSSGESISNSKTIKNLAASQGAVLSGIVKTDTKFLYSIRGRGPWYGNPVTGVLPNTIIFAVEMDEEAINHAPAVEASMEVVNGYLKAASIGLAVKYSIDAMGYRAVCHMDGESEIIMPSAAVAAGLGSFGLLGLLVTRKFGPRVRLAAVTTDMPLSVDIPPPFSLLKFCKTCGKCETFCPSNAIPKYSDIENGDIPAINHESCYKTWKELGTDCGVCLAACPFSHKKKAEGKNEEKKSDFLKNYLYRT